MKAPRSCGAGVWEQVGHTLWTRFSGVIMVEAGKQIYAASPSKAVARRQRRFVVLPGRAPAARVAPDKGEAH